MNPGPRRRRIAWAVCRRSRMLPLLAVLGGGQICRAEPYPRPPCGESVTPPYSQVGQMPTVRHWSSREGGADWKPPACTGWTGTGFSSLIATAARFRSGDGVDGLLRRLGAVSGLAGIRYWSATHGKWRTLIASARALRDEKADQPRQDFLPEEMTQGSVLHFEQVDNLTGTAVYRLRILQVSTGRLRWYCPPWCLRGDRRIHSMYLSISNPRCCSITTCDAPASIAQVAALLPERSTGSSHAKSTRMALLSTFRLVGQTPIASSDQRQAAAYCRANSAKVRGARPVTSPTTGVIPAA